MQFLDCYHTTEAALKAFDSSNEGNDMNSQNGKNGSDADSALFARGSRMQSYLKKPPSPTQIGAAARIINSLKKVLDEAGLEALVSFPVVHCPQAYGVVLQASSRINNIGKTIPGWKVVYSGDTRPCPELVRAAHGATVLIHEVSDDYRMML